RDRLLERRGAALQQVADLGDLVGVDLAKQVGEHGRELLATRGLLQLLEALCEHGKRQHRSFDSTGLAFSAELREDHPRMRVALTNWYLEILNVAGLRQARTPCDG